jgi:hypothetical protein
MDKKKPTKRKWMAKAFGKNPGKLHRKLHVPVDEPIPESKLREAEHSSDATLRREAVLAETGKRYAGRRHKKTA